MTEVLRAASVALNDIELFAAAVGPGSFTGLRIGLATTKALAATLSRPCASVPTLAAVARAAGPAENILALLPAGRGEVFVQQFSVSAIGEVTEVDQPAHIPPAQVLKRYTKIINVTFAGEGAQLHRKSINDYSTKHGLNWSVAPLDRELARQVCLIALTLYRTQQVIDPEALQAIYVRPSDAELKTNVVNH
jgi:tRNA threonylcarbamoyladenosine biosynthesis protein TsaB